MSTQAIGAAAAGTAVIGGGGTLVAYAAGAFDLKEKDWQQATFEEYAQSLGLKYVGVTGNTSLGELPDKEKIKKKIEDNSKGAQYRAILKKHWGNMENKDVIEVNKPTRPEEEEGVLFPSDSTTRTKDSEVADWTKSWCKAAKDISNKIKRAKGEGWEWNTDLLNKNNKWKAFEEVCFETKEG
ncbi:hypothetical protein [Candidatus Mycoplasma haematohominis]|uniref:Uncharacterized protein n=1 Tax=Candidatus Mycoplasma haematohominis TaxID=1494318 RepID=A0A478FRC0_9MOLU|nr:hypothetical protein [Candidatus Mycoplasma haemohominis]GCE63717.1 hypothetical protein MHSWG343_07170 [Candidatus Mycoplasma haemohominis]